ncbi:SDR family NAD(P)-dependent oxidoreductase [Streptomyces sp. NPDC059743]|uniref:SDR family NAD(P)-dependent oxidoreductase n=1 Tax=Streptomyces sp. NPDC059743 TaxID=3346928 RepID=UPI0036561485
MTRQFAGRIALVTGGGSGTGRATALAPAAEGALVTVAGRTEDTLNAGCTADTLKETVGLIEADVGNARYAVADVSDEPAVRYAVETAVGDTGRLDFAVEVAPGGPSGGQDRPGAQDRGRRGPAVLRNDHAADRRAGQPAPSGGL